MTNYTINQELNGIEISFDGKPETATIDALKASGYRWHRVKKIWYAKNTAERLSLAQSLTDGQATAPAPAKKSVDKINLDNLGINAPHLYGAELAKAIREDLKSRDVTGVTVRARKITYDTGITVTIKATAEDIASVEEMKLRYNYSKFTCHTDRGFFNGSNWVYNFDELTDEQKQAEYDKYIRHQLRRVNDFSTHYNERKDCPELATAFWEKCLAVFKIANQWNYDNSDSMTDYFDVGYYLDIDIKKPDDFEPREEMTEEERTAYEEEKRQEAEERAAQIERWKKEEEERKERERIYQEQRQKDREQIFENISVQDLDESEQIYITNLVGGFGKECTLDELRESEEKSYRREDALITRKVVFSDMTTFEIFCKYLIDDFDFLEGKGGTASEDVRLEEVKNLYSLNADQRESVKLFMNDCVGVYVGDSLRMVCNPEGYSYSRYTYEPTEESDILTAKEEKENQRKASKALTPFYIPDPVEVQAQKIKEGHKITVYQCDGWNLVSVYDSFGTVLSSEPGTYAQYKGIWITYTNGKRTFIRDGKKCLIYNGIKPLLPDNVTKREFDSNMSLLYNSDDLFKNILDYYGKKGEKPIIDTIQR